MLTTKQPVVSDFFCCFEWVASGYPRWQTGIVAVLDRWAWLKTPVDRVGILQYYKGDGDGESWAQYRYINERECEGSDVWCLREKESCVNGARYRWTPKLRACSRDEGGRLAMWTNIPHWPREATLILTKMWNQYPNSVRSYKLSGLFDTLSPVGRAILYLLWVTLYHSSGAQIKREGWMFWQNTVVVGITYERLDTLEMHTALWALWWKRRLLMALKFSVSFLSMWKEGSLLVLNVNLLSTLQPIAIPSTSSICSLLLFEVGASWKVCMKYKGQHR